MSTKCMSRKSAYISLGIGVFIFVISVAVLLIFPILYNKILSKEIALAEGSLSTKIWKDIPLPLYQKIYFFNITNEEQFLKNEEKLNVTEVGPYTYVSKWVKDCPQWNPNGTVSYREVRTYNFVPDMSVGSEDDQIYSLNGPMLSAADSAKKDNIAERIGLSFFLKLEGETLIIKRSIRELVYEGYKDKIIEDLAPLFMPNLPFKNGLFSWLYGKNATDDGVFTVYTGENDASKTNMIDNWNGRESLTYWKDDTCNMLNGTSMETGPPFYDGQKSYTFFQSLICRSVTFDYTGDGLLQGITTKRFEANDKLFANGSENPDNACFDLQPGRPSGVLDISPCQYGSPVFLSFPHFLMADSSYGNNINGLSPNSEGHKSSLEIDPVTGMTVKTRVRFQININVQKVRGILQLDNVQEGIYPVFWLEISITLNERWGSFLKGQLNNPKIIVYTVGGILALASLILIICSMVVLYLSRNVEDDSLLDINNDKKDCYYSTTTDGRALKNGQQPIDNKNVQERTGEINQGLDMSSEHPYQAAAHM